MFASDLLINIVFIPYMLQRKINSQNVQALAPVPALTKFFKAS